MTVKVNRKQRLRRHRRRMIALGLYGKPRSFLSRIRSWFRLWG